MTPRKLTVQLPDDATPQPIPEELAVRLDALPIEDGEAFWEVSRLVEYAHRLGYAGGHARGYRDKDREVTVSKERERSVSTTQGLRQVAPKGQ